MISLMFKNNFLSIILNPSKFMIKLIDQIMLYDPDFNVYFIFSLLIIWLAKSLIVDFKFCIS